MKTKVLNITMWVAQIVGLILCMAACLCLIGALNDVITTDKGFLLCLFGGMGICCIGFLIDAYLQPAYSMEYKRRRKQSIQGMIISIICCIILVLAVWYGL